MQLEEDVARELVAAPAFDSQACAGPLRPAALGVWPDHIVCALAHIDLKRGAIAPQRSLARRCHGGPLPPAAMASFDRGRCTQRPRSSFPA